MPKMICCNCQVEYRPDRNGVVVIDMFQQPPQPYKLYEADRWYCPGCGHKVVAGFGQRYAEHFQPDFDEQLAAALRKPHVYNFERVGDAAVGKPVRLPDDEIRRRDEEMLKALEGADDD